MSRESDSGPRHNEIVEAVELAGQYEAAGNNSYRRSVVKMLDGLAACLWALGRGRSERQRRMLRLRKSARAWQLSTGSLRVVARIAAKTSGVTPTFRSVFARLAPATTSESNCTRDIPQRRAKSWYVKTGL